MSNQVHQPSHYMSNGEETIVKIVRELGIVASIDFCEANIIKYADRANYKGQKESDLKKIQEYTKMANDLKAIWQNTFAIMTAEFNLKDFNAKSLCYVQKWSEQGHSLKGLFDE